MAITRLLSNFDTMFQVGAFCPLDDLNLKHTALVIYTTHVGTCLFKTEATDADYMLVWNEELQCPERIECPTRRGPPSLPDATPAVTAQYEAWQVRKNQAATINNKWYKRRLDRDLAKEMNLASYHAVRRLRAGLSEEHFRHAISLLAVKKYKSTQRSTLAGMLRAWANNPTPKFPTPLSPNQLKSL